MGGAFPVPNFQPPLAPTPLEDLHLHGGQPMCLVVFFNASSLKTDLLLFNLAALLPETQPQTNIVPSPPAETFN